MELWRCVIRGYMKARHLPSKSREVIEYAWYDVNVRQKQLWQLVDPSQNSTKKVTRASKRAATEYFVLSQIFSLDVSCLYNPMAPPATAAFLC